MKIYNTGFYKKFKHTHKNQISIKSKYVFNFLKNFNDQREISAQLYHLCI